MPGSSRNSLRRRHHPLDLHIALRGISKDSIRRCARRGGVKRISGLIYDEARRALLHFLQKVIWKAVHYTEHSRRKTVTALDVVYSLKSMGKTVYGYGG